MDPCHPLRLGVCLTIRNTTEVTAGDLWSSCSNTLLPLWLVFSCATLRHSLQWVVIHPGSKNREAKPIPHNCFFVPFLTNKFLAWFSRHWRFYIILTERSKYWIFNSYNWRDGEQLVKFAKEMLNCPFTCSLVPSCNTENEVCLWVEPRSTTIRHHNCSSSHQAPNKHTQTLFIYICIDAQVMPQRRRVLGPRVQCLKRRTDVTLAVCVPASCFRAWCRLCVYLPMP